MAKNLAKVLKADMPRLPLRKAAEELRKKGRGRDTILAHITPREAAKLKAEGGSGTINPETGLPEFDDGFDFGGFNIFSGPTYDTTQAPVQTDTFQSPVQTDASQPQPGLSPTEMRDVATGLQNDYNYQVGNQSQFGAAPGQELWNNYFTSGTPQDYYNAQVAQQFGGEIPQPVARPDALGAIYAAAPQQTFPTNVMAYMPDATGKTTDQAAPEDVGSRGDMTVKQQDTAGKTPGGIQTPLGTIGLKEALALGGLGLGGMSYLNAQNQAKKYAAAVTNAANTAAQQQTQLAQPYMQQGGQQLATAIQGGLSPAAQQQLQAAQARAAQGVASSGGVGALQAGMAEADLYQRLRSQDQANALALLGAGTPIMGNAINTQFQGTNAGLQAQLAQSQNAGQAAMGLFGALAKLYG